MKFRTTIAINGEERSHFVVYQFNKQDEFVTYNGSVALCFLEDTENYPDEIELNETDERIIGLYDSEDHARTEVNRMFLAAYAMRLEDFLSPRSIEAARRGNPRNTIDFRYSGRDIRINRISETITKLI